MTSVDTITQWREDWSSASVVNHAIVTDPTIRQPGFHLPRHTWSPMNRFRTGQGPCRANLHKCGLAQSLTCDCGQRQTMNHIVNTCPLTQSEGGLNLLHEADDDAVMWLESTATAALSTHETNNRPTYLVGLRTSVERATLVKRPQASSTGMRRQKMMGMIFSVEAENLSQFASPP